MHFFYRYSYIWKFKGNQEHDYTNFVQPSNLVYLRLVSFITIFGMSLFLLIDYFKAVDFSLVLFTRICVLIGASIVMWLSFKSLRLVAFVICVISIVAMNLGAALVTATFAGMPSFYLTNLLFLIFLLVVTASGLHFRHALFVNLGCLIVFLLYSRYIHTDPFYYSQYPHLLSVFVYIHIVGVVLESRRRKNFIQFKDLSEQKRLVEELNQQKNKVISILSHDVASPMNSLSTILHLWGKDKLSNEELNTYLSKLTSEFHNVSFLLHSLVRWSRSQLEGFVLDKTEIDVIGLIEKEITLFQPQFSDKHLKVKLMGGESYRVNADEDMIRIAIRNLISNAAKFARDHSEILLKVSEKGEKLGISISNQGDPIPLHVRKKLFSYQMPTGVDTRGDRGTGLGLAMSSYFIHLHEGDISLVSSEEEATVFCMELPCQVSKSVLA